MPGTAKRILHAISYRMRWLGLNLYGPADQDPAVDPLQQLKREHDREMRQEPAEPER